MPRHDHLWGCVTLLLPTGPGALGNVTGFSQGFGSSGPVSFQQTYDTTITGSGTWSTVFMSLKNINDFYGGSSGNSQLTATLQLFVPQGVTVSSGSGQFPIVVVPLPAALWLFGSGVIGLLAVGRRRKAAA